MTNDLQVESICAWADWPASTIAFCEARTCDFPAEPANAWSNLAYVLVGVYILYLARRQARWPLWPAGVTAIGIGLGSFAFHAFPTFYTEYADLVSMFLLATYLLAVQLYRWWQLKVGTAVFVYATVLLVSCVALWIHKDIGIAIFAVELIAATTIEAVLYRRHPHDQPHQSYRYFWILGVVFWASLAIWVMDLSGIVCDPNNHFLQGHALWHIANSTCLYWMYRYAMQFDWAKSNARARTT